MKIRRLAAACFAALLISAEMCGTVTAEETDPTGENTAQQSDVSSSENADEQGNAEEEKTPEQLAQEAQEREEAKKKEQYAIAVDSNSLTGWPQGPSVYADAAVVVDMDSGSVLYAKQAEKQHFPASITKLLTVLVALENASLADTVTFSEDSVSFLNYDDANIGMQPGEQIRMNDALYAVLLASANEVSYAVAENTGAKMGGDYNTFIERMNTRAAELGCTGSHWVNANGLHDEEHYTTAHDMARIASAVYQREEFRTMMGMLEYKIAPTNLVNEERVFQQNHKMMWPENYYYYEYCKGGKTGYTDQSGTTLVTMADDGNLHLAAVVMGDFGVDAYTDTRAMLDYCFQNFRQVPLEGTKMSEEIDYYISDDAFVTLPNDFDISQAELHITEAAEHGTGTVQFSYGEQELGSAEVVLSDKYYENSAPKFKKTTGKEQEEVQSVPGKKLGIRKILVVAAAVLAVFCLLVLRVRAHRRRRKKKRRIRK